MGDLQHALRLIAFRQIHKVLGMDLLPKEELIVTVGKRPREMDDIDNKDKGNWKPLIDKLFFSIQLNIFFSIEVKKKKPCEDVEMNDASFPEEDSECFSVKSEIL